ncbi:hypothetical protein C4D60_Mb04t26020 [Musa balbisiana]|uniref:Uncharacterized protein n=1 Tax=Musa balbisiana TaxID=52838 RepID=A0A4S8KEV0_MUSBA|nr:hypothetical protein C4D60_Mb04t26020 [Musa balbisiana]
MKEPPTSSSPVNLLCPDWPLPHRPLYLARRSEATTLSTYPTMVAFSCAHVSSLMLAQWTLLCSSNSKSCLHDKVDNSWFLPHPT